jgi:hypothetical protein
MTMTTTTKQAHKAIVSLKLPIPVAMLIAFARTIVTKLTGNPYFPSPTPSLAQLTASIDGLVTAETAALGRAKGAVAARNQQKAVLVTELKQLKAYIQSVADAAPAENAVAIIESSGVTVRKTATRTARTFAATAGPVSGTAALRTAAAGRASYDWEYSTDGGKTWISAPSTLKAKTTITGLTPTANVQFRFRALTKTGEGDWSQPVALVIS